MILNSFKTTDEINRISIIYSIKSTNKILLKKKQIVSIFKKKKQQKNNHTQQRDTHKYKTKQKNKKKEIIRYKF